MKLYKYILPTSLFVFFILIVSFRAQNKLSNYSDCITAYDGKWGSRCNTKDSYEIKFRKDCTEAVDIQCAVQNTNKTWSAWGGTNVAPGASVTGYNCHSTGKYKFWARKTGDYKTHLPSSKEINEMGE